MKHRLIVDQGACAGHGLCYGGAPEIVRPDDQGEPIVIADPLPPSLLDLANHIVATCPERALSVSEA